MKEYVVDRAEGGLLVCFAGDGDRLTLSCKAGSRPALPRPEGWRVFVFGSPAASRPYLRIAGAVIAADGRCALIMPPDGERAAAVRERFENIFKKST